MLTTWSLTSQLDEVTRTLLHLKAWRFVFLLLTLVLLFSGAYLSVILGKCDLDADSELRFYRNVELATAWKLQVGKTAGQSDSLKLDTGSAIRWDEQIDLYCTFSAKTCIEQLLVRAGSQSRRLLESLARAKSSPIMLECLAVNYSNAECSLLYQPNDSKQRQLSALKHLNFLHLNIPVNGTANFSSLPVPLERQNGPSNPPWTENKQNSACNSNNKLFRTIVAVSFSIGTMAVILYFTLSTAYCIHQLKLNNFLKQLHFSGLYAIAYWLPLFGITVVECLMFSGVYLAGQLVQCPEFSLSSNGLLQVFVVYALHSLSLAMLAILCATVLGYADTCTLMMLLNLTLIGGFAYAPGLIESGTTAALYLYPPISGLHLVESRIATDGLNALSSHALAHHDRVFPCLFVTPVVLAIAILYLDFILPEGNGLCLPMYFPISRRFWLPDKEAAVFNSSATPERQRSAFVEYMPAGSIPIAVVDHVSVAYRDRGYEGCCGICRCSCSDSESLRQVSCKIFPGHITWLLGNSGSGKSTLLQLLSGFPQRAASPSVVCGSVTMLNGFQATKPLDRLLVRRQVAATLSGHSQKVNDGICTCLTVKRGLSLTLACRGCVTGTGATATPRELLMRLGLAGVEDQTPRDLNLGQRKLLSLANCLAGNAQLILLDEPTRGLEPASRQRVWRLLRDICRQTASVSIVVAVSQNDLPTIAPGEKIIYLSGGQVAGIGSRNFLARVFNCQRRCVSVTLLQPKQNSTAAVQNLLNRLPNGTVERSPWREGRKLSLLVEPEVLMDCVLTLESAVGKLIANGGIQLEPLQHLRSPKGSLVPSVRHRDNFNAHNEPTVIGESSNSSVNINNNSNSSSSISESCTTPLQPMSSRRENKKDKPRLERLTASTLIRFFALWKVQAKRLVRSRCDFVTRCVIPASFFICLLLITAYKRAFYRTAAPAYLAKESRKLNSSEGANEAKKSFLSTVCVFDEVQNEASVLQYPGCSTPNSLLLGKPSQLKIEAFLLKHISEPKMRASCVRSCLIIYSEQWNRSVSDNGNRSVTVALLDASNGSDVSESQLVYIYRTAVAEIVNHFSALLELVNPKLAYNKQRSASGFHANTIHLLLLTAFSIFPASFFNQVADDMSSNVYRYLSCLGMSRLGYWVCTFSIHWLQYGMFLLILIFVQNTWDRFRNSYYLSCICLPVLVFGTSSNLLSVYTTVALTGKQSNPMKFAYILLVVIAPWTLNGVTKLGNIPVLALIWLVPQVAPLALILFGMNLANQKIEHLDDRGKLILYQLWDMQDGMWNYTLIINSLVAMPTHVILLSLLLACSVCDLYRCIGQHLDCIGKNLFSRGRGANREMLPLSPRPGPASTSQRCILDVRSLWKTCPMSGFPVVKGVGFRLAGGNCLTLVGAGGSGKSTTASIVAGEVMPTSGDCRVFCNGVLCLKGAEPWRHRPNCSAVGYCPDYSPLFRWLTVSEHLHFYARIRGLRFVFACKRIRELLSELGLREYQQRRIGNLDYRIRCLVCLATSLISRPSLLVIDNGSLGDARCYLREQMISSSSKSSDTLGPAILATSESVNHDSEAIEEGELARGEDDDDDDDLAKGETGPARTFGADNCNPVSNVFGVLHRGRIVAMGTRHQLRRIYGNWFILDVTLETHTGIEDTKLEVTTAVLAHFKGSLLLEETDCWTQFCLPASSVGRLSIALNWLDASLASLRHVEQIFLYCMPLDQAIALQQLSIIKRIASTDEDIAT